MAQSAACVQQYIPSNFVNNLVEKIAMITKATYQRHSFFGKSSFGNDNNKIAEIAKYVVSLVGVCLLSAIAEPLVVGDRLAAQAQTSPTIMQLNNILNQAVFGDDQITRYAIAVNAIENKRLEIFRAAKKHPNWSQVANVAESQQTKVCDLEKQPEFLESLCNQLRSFTEEEIRRRGFTNKEFNQITRDQRQDKNLRSVIQTRQLQLRGGN